MSFQTRTPIWRYVNHQMVEEASRLLLGDEYNRLQVDIEALAAAAEDVASR